MVPGQELLPSLSWRSTWDREADLALLHGCWWRFLHIRASNMSR